jgi:hypothetical protein
MTSIAALLCAAEVLGQTIRLIATERRERWSSSLVAMRYWHASDPTACSG